MWYDVVVRGLIDDELDRADDDSPRAPPLEVGVVYQRLRGGPLLMAVGSRSIATVVGEHPRQAFEIRPTLRRIYRPRPDVSTLDLCMAWNVEIEELDAFMAPIVSPDPSGREGP